MLVSMPMAADPELEASTPDSPVPTGMVVSGRISAPVWSADRLYAAPPIVPQESETRGAPVYDVSVGSWFVQAAGTVARLENDGRLTVVADNVQGRDIDVHAAIGLAVSREPNDAIVLHALRPSAGSRTVVLTGGDFFNPRFSPDGSSILVAQSRASGGHLWVVDRVTRKTVDMGQGYSAAWHSDGRHIVFCRISNDSLRITAAELWALDTLTMVESQMTQTSDAHEIATVVSPDGKWLAFIEDRTGRVLMARMPQLSGGGR